MLPETGSNLDFKLAVLNELVVYGIWDTKDKCWMGNADGPLLYIEDWASKAAATIMNARFRSSSRYRRTLFWEEFVVFKDEVTPPLSAEEAMQKERM